MPSPYVTISIDSFKRHWSLVQAAIKGYKPVRNYEAFVLLEANAEAQTLSFRAANQQGGLHAVIDGHDQPSPLTVHTSFAVAIEIESLTKILPFFKGTLDITSVDNRPGEIRFAAGPMEQHVPWSQSMLDDFPYATNSMTERARFGCDDFGRRLRLGSNSASRSSKDANTFPGSVFVQIDASGLRIESAGPTRGVSKMAWKPSDLTTEGPPFKHLIPLSNIHTIARMASNHKGVVVITNDIGGGQIGWQFGGITYTTRTLGEKFFTIDVMYGGDSQAEASVPVESFADITGLIRAQTPDTITAKATIAMLEDGMVEVTSPSTKAVTSARMQGMCGGTLPHKFTMNAGQVGEVLADIKSKTGIIHLDSRLVAGKNPILRVTSPDEPDFIHVAVLMSEVMERNVEVNDAE